MQLQLFVAVCLCVVLNEVSAGNKKKCKKQCEIGQCTFPDGASCGRGTANWTCPVGCENFAGKKPCRSKCKASPKCKYSKSRWSDCDESTGLKTRVASLRPNSPETCTPKQKSETKKCRTGSKRCVYTAWSTFGECTNNKKEKTRSLTSGDSRICIKTRKYASC